MLYYKMTHSSFFLCVLKLIPWSSFTRETNTCLTSQETLHIYGTWKYITVSTRIHCGRNILAFAVRSCQTQPPPSSWRTTPFPSSMAAYSIYLQLPPYVQSLPSVNTKYRDQVARTLASYLGGHRFKSLLSRAKFSWLSSVPPSKFRNSNSNLTMTVSYTHLFHFIIHQSFYQLRIYSVNYWQCH
jgi:hypothetical protein